VWAGIIIAKTPDVFLPRAIHKQIVNHPPFGLRPAPGGALAQDEPGLVLSKLLGSASKPVSTPLAF
jgi:hypothetical protein